MADDKKNFLSKFVDAFRKNEKKSNSANPKWDDEDVVKSKTKSYNNRVVEKKKYVDETGAKKKEKTVSYIDKDTGEKTGTFTKSREVTDNYVKTRRSGVGQSASNRAAVSFRTVPKDEFYKSVTKYKKGSSMREDQNVRKIKEKQTGQTWENEKYNIDRKGQEVDDKGRYVRTGQPAKGKITTLGGYNEKTINQKMKVKGEGYGVKAKYKGVAEYDPDTKEKLTKREVAKRDPSLGSFQQDKGKISSRGNVPKNIMEKIKRVKERKMPQSYK